MQNTPRAIILGAILLPAASLQADELALVNGDSLQGTTVAQTDSHLIWLSDNFGELTIALKRVASINGECLHLAIASEGNYLSPEPMPVATKSARIGTLELPLNGVRAIIAMTPRLIMRVTA
jgi:hypothetical protein